jgi:hypothetical protein
VIFTPKRSTNLAEKTLADGKSVKPGAEAKKWTKWSKFTFHSPKTRIILFSYHNVKHTPNPKIKKGNKILPLASITY